MTTSITQNRLLDHIITERKGHYCHVLELDSSYAYECVIESIVGEFKDTFTQDEIISFFDTIEIYYYNEYSDMLTYDENGIIEFELYNFDHKQFIIDCY